jgi:hypothetical protein
LFKGGARELTYVYLLGERPPLFLAATLR